MEAAASVLMHVMLRKSFIVYRELAFMVVNILSLVNSIVRVSGFFLARSGTFSGRRSPRSSMFLRYDG